MESTLNISANLKAVDTIKSEILYEVSRLYHYLSEYNDDDNLGDVTEAVATIIAMDYILARRVGISFSDIDKKILSFLNMAIDQNHELEIEFSDMSDLKRYIDVR